MGGNVVDLSAALGLSVAMFSFAMGTVLPRIDACADEPLVGLPSTSAAISRRRKVIRRTLGGYGLPVLLISASQTVLNIWAVLPLSCPFTIESGVMALSAAISLYLTAFAVKANAGLCGALRALSKFERKGIKR